MNGENRCDRSLSREVHKAIAEIGDHGSAIAFSPSLKSLLIDILNWIVGGRMTIDL